MGECFWSKESVIGLTKVCTAAAPAGDVLSFAPSVNDDGYFKTYEPGHALIARVAGYAYMPLVELTPAFTTAIEAALYVGKVTGVAVAASGALDAYIASQYPGLSTPLPGDVVFTTVDAPLYIVHDELVIADVPTPPWVPGALLYTRVEVGGSVFYGLCAPGTGV